MCEGGTASSPSILSPGRSYLSRNEALKDGEDAVPPNASMRGMLYY